MRRIGLVTVSSHVRMRGMFFADQLLRAYVVHIFTINVCCGMIWLILTEPIYVLT
jgi:hypothetical protein